MDRSYLVKVLLCETVDRLKSLAHSIDSLDKLPDEKLMRILKYSDRMMQTVADATKEWKEHCLRCNIAHGLIRKEAIKRGLLKP